MKHIIYQILRPDISDGDVLLFTRKDTLISRLISHVTGSRHVHVALAKWDGDRLKTCEFREFVGYQERYVSEVGEFDHVATGFQWSKETDAFIKTTKDKPYSYLDAVKAGFGLRLSQRGYICSEFVTDVLKDQIKGLPVSPTPANLSLWFWDKNYPMQKVSSREVSPPGANEHLKISELEPQLNKALPSGAFFMETDMSEPKHYKIAKQLEADGLKEIPGKKHNPQVLQLYKTVGRPDVKNDETAWCAAFVGHCLVKGGYQHTPVKVSLLARSYEGYGSTVYKKATKKRKKVGDISAALPGDICIFPRGNSTWQGHVAFFVRETPKSVYVLGGNQNNEVNIKRYSKSKLITIRRPDESCLLRPKPAMPKLEELPAGNDNTQVKQPLNVDVSKAEKVVLGRKLEKKPLHKSRSVWSQVAVLVGMLMSVFQNIIDGIKHVVDVIAAPVFKIRELIPDFSLSNETMGLMIIVGAVGVALYAYADDRDKLDGLPPAIKEVEPVDLIDVIEEEAAHA